MINAQATDVLDRWVEAVNDGDVDAILGLYSETHVLLPTFSPHTIRGEDATRQYFVQLASREGLNVEVHTRTLTEQRVGEHHRVLIGIYTWNFEVDGEPISFASRFTFVIDLNAGRPIVHHHSSQMPRTLD